MVKPSKLLARKVAKYEKKVAERESAQNAAESSSATPTATTARVASSAKTARRAVKKTGSLGKKLLPKLATIAASSATAPGAQSTVVKKKKVVHMSAADDVEGADAAAAFTTQERNAQRIARMKEKLQLRKSGAIPQASMETIAERAAATLAKKGGTTLNLSAARRHDLFVTELNQFNAALQVPAFQQDPFAAVMAHLDQTATLLSPQTENCGRRDNAAKVHTAPKHAKYSAGRGSK